MMLAEQPLLCSADGDVAGGGAGDAVGVEKIRVVLSSFQSEQERE